MSKEGNQMIFFLKGEKPYPVLVIFPKKQGENRNL